MREVDHNHHISSRALAQQFGVSQTTAWKCLNKNNFHPYKVTPVQELTDEDFLARLEFCNWLLTKHLEDYQFLDGLLMSDECQFYNDGSVNRHNCHYYAQENPHWAMDGHTQRRWHVNVWCGIVGNHVVGPYFIEGNVDSLSYVNFLNNILPELLENVPLQIRMRMWFQQDGHPAHTAIISRDALNRIFEDKWIGKYGPVEWPARSPDLSKLDFYLWGRIKDIVYQTRPNTKDELKQRIRDAIANITPEELWKVTNSLVHRAHLCIDNDGKQFEHLLNR